MAQIASEMRLQYLPKDDWGFIRRLLDFKLFKGHTQHCIHSMLMERDELAGTECRVFDYEAADGYGSEGETHYTTVFYVNSKQLGLPEMTMQPEQMFHKVAQWFGVKDINFEEYPQFSAQYWLRGDDEERVRYHMSDDILHYFTIEPNWTLETCNFVLLFYQEKRLLDGGEVIELYRKGRQLVHWLLEQEKALRGTR